MAGGTIRAGTPAKIGIPGNGDLTATFVGGISPGHLTVSGKTLGITRTRSISPGHLTLSGKTMRVNSTAWQYITITSLVSIGSQRTLYDSLDPMYGLTPSIGDIWRVPVFSQDGGALTVSGDARFEIGAPTAGYDVLPAVLYYNLITGLWYGPADFTILNPPLTLSVIRGHLNVQGKQMTMNRTRALVPGRLVVFGHQVALHKNRAIDPGHLTLTGKQMQLNRQMVMAPGHLTISGKVLSLSAKLTMRIDPGHLTISGKDLGFARSLPIEPGRLTIAGKDMYLFTGQPLYMTPGHLQVTGQVLRLNKTLLMDPGHLTVRGKSMTLTQPERRLEYASPLRMTDVSDEYRMQ